MKSINLSALVATLLFSWALSTHSWAAQQETLEELIVQAKNLQTLQPEKKQREASVYIARQLLLSHYRKKNIDKSLSEKVFENYLDSIDSQRIYFLQSDIDDFEPYRFRLHGALKTGQLEPGFNIYNRYQQRLVERLLFQIDYLDKSLKTMRFDKNEYVLSDRSEVEWAETKEELEDIWRRRLKSAVLSLVLSDETKEQAAESLRKRYKNQLKRALQVRSEDAFQAYMNAFTTVYDPHTNYFSPRSSENFNINMSLSLEGIGAVLQSDNEFTKVVRLIAGGPAQLQGSLGPADRIVGVAQDKEEMVNVIGWRLDEVVDLIRGPKKSTVRLEVIPASAKLDTDTEEIVIVRDKVKLEDQAASSNIIETDRNGANRRIGVISIPTFYADFQAMQAGESDYKSTTRDVLNLLNEMRIDGNIDGLVIDLRGNGGGSLDEANRLTGLFIDQGPTVQIRSANNRVEVMGDSDPTLSYDGPLMVLVDRLSASASEIFAGAIQDYGRGLVMGSQTFGKGTVQSVRPLNHGQLKITQAKFYRISGASTQHKGVLPDILVPDIFDRTKVGEDALDNALPWDSIASADYSGTNIPDRVDTALITRHEERFAQEPKYQILLEEIELLESQRERKQVSLNQKVRLQEIDAYETAQLDIENKRRKLDGLKPFKTMEEWDDYLEAEQSKTKTNEASEIDFIVEESAEVLLDFIELTQEVVAKAA